MEHEKALASMMTLMVFTGIRVPTARAWPRLTLHRV